MRQQPHGDMKIAEALQEAVATLLAAGIAEARPDARALLTHALARDHAFLIAHSDEEIDPAWFPLFAFVLWLPCVSRRRR